MSEDERSERARGRTEERREQRGGGGEDPGEFSVHMLSFFFFFGSSLKQFRSGMPLLLLLLSSSSSPPPLLAWGSPQCTCSLRGQLTAISEAFLSDRCTVTLSQAQPTLHTALRPTDTRPPSLRQLCVSVKTNPPPPPEKLSFHSY